ncbi:MAG: twin-arginine translocation signal domain-containing protein, partial [Cyclobacteriaceae bacterium]|nr:twin-arginine translocation signal domain-containing protein [Cyclobacteriaceae bacterium]
MQRRNFIKKASLAGAGVSAGLLNSKAYANVQMPEPVKMKITKIRYYSAPGYTKPLFNQARGIVAVETDGGIIGIGEGGAKDTIEQVAQMLIGENPFSIEHL